MRWNHVPRSLRENFKGPPEPSVSPEATYQIVTPNALGLGPRLVLALDPQAGAATDSDDGPSGLSSLSARDHYPYAGVTVFGPTSSTSTRRRWNLATPIGPQNA